jgi:type II secretion system (T2SS) protein E
MTAEAAAWEGGLVGGDGAAVEAGARRGRVPLGTLLVEAGVASEADIRDALDEGNRTGERLGEVVLRRGWISERKLTKLLAEQWGLRAPGPVKMQVDPAALARIDAERAAELGGIPFEFDEDGLVVAVAEPKTDRFEAFQALLGNVSFVVVAPSTLTELLDTRGAMLETTSSPAERVGAWLQPPTESPQAAQETNGSDTPDQAPLDDVNLATESADIVEQTHTRDTPDEAPLDEAHSETDSADIVEQTHARDTPDETPLDDVFKDEPLPTIEHPHEETQPAAHEPTSPAFQAAGSVIEHLYTLIGAVDAFDHELTETRRRLQAQETELAELRRARASDLETISNLGAELEERRSRMEAFQAAARELAAELDR